MRRFFPEKVIIPQTVVDQDYQYHQNDSQSNMKDVKETAQSQPEDQQQSRLYKNISEKHQVHVRLFQLALPF